MNEQHYILLAIFAFLVFSFSFLITLRKRRIGHIEESLKKTLFLVRLPRYDSKEGESKENMISLIGKMEQIYSHFLSLKKGSFLKRFFKGVPNISLEIASTVGGGDISFYIAVPSYMENSFHKYVQGAYPGANINKEEKDYTIFEPKGYVSGAYLRLKSSYCLPIKSYKEMNGDPLESITNSLTKINPDEGSAIQVIIRPADRIWKKRTKRFFQIISREGKSVSEASSILNEDLFIKILKVPSEIFSPPQKRKEADVNLKVDQSTLDLVQEKSGKPLFEVNVRLLAASKEKGKSEEILENIKSGFVQFSSINEFDIKEVKGRELKKLVYDFSFRNLNSAKSMLLTTEELVGVYHLPLSHIKTPYIKWVNTKEAPPPSDLPFIGPLLIGKTVFRGEDKDIYIASKEDRRRHFYIIGQTGVGKSAFMENMICQDIANGEGVGVIDPHGGVVENVLSNIPANRADDVVLFEPFDTSRPCGVNMLEWDLPEQKDFAVSEMISIFMQLFPPEVIGPIFEHYMRNAMLALMADKDNPGTLTEIPRMFTDDGFMKEKVSKINDPMVRGFWTREWSQTTEKTRSDMLGYIVSKIGRFIENDMMRNIIGQQHSSFDLEKIMNGKKIFLANLSKGLTGEINSSLLGLILVSKMQIAAMRRARISEDNREDFYLYIDEFQNFTTNSIASILSEARKYRLNLTLANQYMPQLKEEIKNAVIGNVGTISSYRIGADDAAFLENKFEPEFSKFDLSNLDNYEFIVKMIINGKVSPPFKAKSIPPNKGNKEMNDMIRDLSRLKYGRSRMEVEKEILERSGM